MFCVVETNQFKQLTHLSLKFQPGNDTTIKSYLASRLKQTQTKNSELINTLEKTQQLLEIQTKDEKEAIQQLENYQQERNRQFLALSTSHQDALLAQKEQAMEVLEKTKEKYTTEYRIMEDKLQATISELRDRSSEMETKLGSLTQAKFNSESKERELKLRLDDVTSLYENGKKELLNLREENKELSSLQYTQEKLINQLKLEKCALEQQIKDKEELLNKMNSLVQAADLQKKSIDEALGVYKEKHGELQKKLETSITEINKSNQIIEKIQTESRHFKGKLRLKSKVIRQQEQMILEKQQDVDDIQRQMESLKMEYQEKKRDNETLQEKLTQANSKLEESTKLLQSNQQVISWLNKEINEAQMGRRFGTSGGGGGGGGGGVPKASYSHLSGLATGKPKFQPSLSSVTRYTMSSMVSPESDRSSPFLFSDRVASSIPQDNIPPAVSTKE